MAVYHGNFMAVKSVSCTVISMVKLEKWQILFLKFFDKYLNVLQHSGMISVCSLCALPSKVKFYKKTIMQQIK